MAGPASPFRTAEQRLLDREAKRDAVLLAAVKMFNERGFQATSLDDVAASLGITKPTIYHYLGNKDKVLLECLTLGLNQLITAVDEANREAGSGLDRLRHFLERYAEINMSPFGQSVIRTDAAFLSGDSAIQFKELKRRIDASLRDLIRDAMADGSIAPQDPKLLTFTLAGALNWPARWYDPKGDLTPVEISRAMVDILLAGLLPRS